MPDSGAYTSFRRLTLVGLTVLPALLALLYFVRLPSLSDPALALMLVLLSWCLYHYFLPFHHLRRRAVLAHVTAENSLLRRWLWKGFWSRLWLVFVCAVLALALLMVANGLSNAEWLWLLLCTPVLLLVLPWTMRLTGNETEVRYHFPLALRVAVWICVALATLGLVVVQLVSDVPDTRGMGLIELVSQTWQTASGQSAVPLVSTLIALEAVTDASVWHLMQQAATLSTQPAWLKLLVWLVFLLFLTVRAAIVWFALAGALYWLAVPRVPGDHREDPPLRTFGLGMLILGLLAWLLSLPGMSSYMLALTDNFLNGPQPVRSTASSADPCEMQAPQELASLRREVEQQRVTEQQRLQYEFVQASQAALDEVFAQAEPLVEQYLDWNYSLTGQYQQLGVLIAASARNVAGRMSSNNTVATIEDAMAAYLSAQIDQRLQPVLTPALLEKGAQLEIMVQGNAAQLVARQLSYTEQLAASSVCLRFELPALVEIGLDQKSLVGLGPITGALAARIAARSSVHAGSALVGRQATKRMISATSARVASHTAQSATAGAAGGFCGPLAPVCVPALFAATWLATDLALNELDEALNRDQLKAELLAALDAEKQRLLQQYQDAFLLFSEQLMLELDADQEQLFRIIEQGIAPGDGNLRLRTSE